MQTAVSLRPVHDCRRLTIFERRDSIQYNWVQWMNERTNINIYKSKPINHHYRPAAVSPRDQHNNNRLKRWSGFSEKNQNLQMTDWNTEPKEVICSRHSGDITTSKRRSPKWVRVPGTTTSLFAWSDRSQCSGESCFLYTIIWQIWWRHVTNAFVSELRQIIACNPMTD